MENAHAPLSSEANSLLSVQIRLHYGRVPLSISERGGERPDTTAEKKLNRLYGKGSYDGECRVSEVPPGGALFDGVPNAIRVHSRCSGSDACAHKYRVPVPA